MIDGDKITISATINASVETVWKVWTEPEHIKKWNNASEDWHTTAAENDLTAGGRFLSRMEAKDGSFGFDFSGTYEEVKLHEVIAYTLDDNRTVYITFKAKANATEIVQTFEAENEFPKEYQEQGWLSILNNFKQYTEQQLH